MTWFESITSTLPFPVGSVWQNHSNTARSTCSHDNKMHDNDTFIVVDGEGDDIEWPILYNVYSPSRSVSSSISCSSSSYAIIDYHSQSDTEQESCANEYSISPVSCCSTDSITPTISQQSHDTMTEESDTSANLHDWYYDEECNIWIHSHNYTHSYDAYEMTADGYDDDWYEAKQDCICGQHSVCDACQYEDMIADDCYCFMHLCMMDLCTLPYYNIEDITIRQRFHYLLKGFCNLRAYGKSEQWCSSNSRHCGNSSSVIHHSSNAVRMKTAVTAKRKPNPSNVHVHHQRHKPQSVEPTIPDPPADANGKPLYTSVDVAYGNIHYRQHAKQYDEIEATERYESRRKQIKKQLIATARTRKWAIVLHTRQQRTKHVHHISHKPNQFDKPIHTGKQNRAVIVKPKKIRGPMFPNGTVTKPIRSSVTPVTTSTQPAYIAPSVAPKKRCRVEDHTQAVLPFTHYSSYDDFRHKFYEATREKLLHSFQKSDGSAVCDIRFVPLGEEARSRFMNYMEQTKTAASLCYHGTHINSMQSICDRGLLVPHSKNGVSIRNGSALGVGVYTARRAVYSQGYMRGTCTLFACAVLEKNANPNEVYSSGHVVVLYNHARVVPMFLVDVKFGARPYAYYSYNRLTLSRCCYKLVVLRHHRHLTKQRKHERITYSRLVPTML